MHSCFAMSPPVHHPRRSRQPGIPEPAGAHEQTHSLGYFPSLGCPPPSRKFSGPLASTRREGRRFGLVPPLLAALPALSARNPAVRSSREAGSRCSTQSPCQKTETRRIRTVRSRAISASGRRSVRSKRFKLMCQVTARGPPPHLGGLSRLVVLECTCSVSICADG